MPLADAEPIAFVITRDRSVAEPFYADVLGLPRLPAEPYAAVFDLAGRKLRITEVPGFEPGAHPVLGWKVADMSCSRRCS